MMNALPANALKLLVLFGFLLITLDLLLVRWLKLSKFAWKRIEYIWLGTVALGLISASAEVRNWLAAQQAQTAKLRAETQFSLLRNCAGEVAPPSYICRKFVRTEYSPDNLDEIQAEYDKFCEWNKQLLVKLPVRLIDDLPDLKYSDYEPEKNPNDEVLIEYLSTIKMYFSNYQTYRNEYIVLNKASTKSNFEITLFCLSPIFLCFALALRITKVTGEINLEK
jgi:hypothetical protein